MNVHTGIGASILRKEDRRFITGKGNYVADIKRPDMAMGVFLRSPHAHALIKGIDIKAAAALPGVAAIFTGADLAADKIGGLPCAWGVSNADGTPMKEPPRSAMAVDKVRCVGDAVAFVIADTIEQAREAADAIEIDYEVLPAVVGVLDAIAPALLPCSTTSPTTPASTGSAATPRRRRRHSRMQLMSPRSAW